MNRGFRALVGHSLDDITPAAHGHTHEQHEHALHHTRQCACHGGRITSAPHRNIEARWSMLGVSFHWSTIPLACSRKGSAAYLSRRSEDAGADAEGEEELVAFKKTPRDRTVDGLRAPLHEKIEPLPQPHAPGVREATDALREYKLSGQGKRARGR